MNVIRASLAALVLVSVTYGAADQYDEVGHSGATDHPPDGGTPIQPAKTQEDSGTIKMQTVVEFQRKRRSFYEWPASVVAAPAVWPPATYQIQRPYFIPVWGGPGRVPIYFPPQPILFDDPRKSYLPPRGYLPPETTENPPSPPGETTVNLSNRGGGDEEDDDRPVWDMNPPAPTRNPLRTTSTQSSVPTRRTRRPGQATTPPPLVHRPSNNTSNNNNNGRPMALRPTQELPPPMRPLTTSPRPLTTTTQRSGRQEPSRCVWAIISCCIAASKDISYSCFEQLGCSGAFWDSSPCESEFAKAAIEVASKYYGNK